MDPLWSALRCVCLCLYWFNPLVWDAAIVSKIDCELACDEGALRGLSQGERIAYGRMLLALIPVRRGGSSPLLSATTMVSDKKRPKDRITRIAEARKPAVSALIAALLMTLVACGAAFTEGQSGSDPSKAPRIPYLGEPVLTLPLDNAKPVESSPVALTHTENDCLSLDAEIALDSGFTVCRYTSTDGSTYMAVVRGEPDASAWSAERFYTFPKNTDFTLYAQDLCTFDCLSHTGVAVARPQEYTMMFDYYTFDEDGQPTLLLTVPGPPHEIDLDGDGISELQSSVFDTTLFFQRDGRILSVNIGKLMQEVWPEADSLDYVLWDEELRLLKVIGYMKVPGCEDTLATFQRYVGFDGKALPVYKISNETEDHKFVSLNLDAIPEQVVTNALRQAEAGYKNTVHGEYAESFQACQPDNWRLTYLCTVEDYLSVPGPELQIYLYRLGIPCREASKGRSGRRSISGRGWLVRRPRK